MKLYGASGHAKVIISILELLDKKISNIFDDRAPFTLLGYEVIHFDESYTDNFIISVGNNKTRKQLAKKLHKVNFINVIHPSAIIDKRVRIDLGTVVMAGVTINVATTIGNTV